MSNVVKKSFYEQCTHMLEFLRLTTMHTKVRIMLVLLQERALSKLDGSNQKSLQHLPPLSRQLYLCTTCIDALLVLMHYYSLQSMRCSGVSVTGVLLPTIALESSKYDKSITGYSGERLIIQFKTYNQNYIKLKHNIITSTKYIQKRKYQYYSLETCIT